MDPTDYDYRDFARWLDRGGDPYYYALSRDFHIGAADALAAYRAVLPEAGGSVLFETGATGDNHGWMIGLEPYAVIEHRDGNFAVIGDGETVTEEPAAAPPGPTPGPPPGPMETLRRLYGRFVPRGDMRATGAYGYIAYEYAHLLDTFHLNAAKSQPPDVPLLHLQFFRVYLHFEAASGLLTVTHIVGRGDAGGDNAASLLGRIAADSWRLAQAVRGSAGAAAPNLPVLAADDPDARRGGFASAVTQGRFEANVRQAKRHIEAGDIFQAVLSFAMRRETDVAPLDVLDAMRGINRSPYMFHLAAGGQQLAGCSPEMLVAARGNQLLLNPIAGTVRRGRDQSEDDRLVTALLRSEKDRAEHVMLVDLGRNDLGKVARTDSVRVDQYMAIEKYSHVSHIVSRVSAEMDAGKDSFDAFAAAFPAGTVSGAPKIRAMEIIDDLESEPRGAYAGAVGCFKFNGDMDFCIAIRTLFFADGKVTARAGAGIVADSDPTSEYEECLNKMAATIRAVTIAEQRRYLQSPNQEVA